MKKTTTLLAASVIALGSSSAFAGSGYYGNSNHMHDHAYFEGGGHGAVHPSQAHRGGVNVRGNGGYPSAPEAPRVHGNKSAYEEMMLQAGNGSQARQGQGQGQRQQYDPYSSGGYGNVQQYGSYGAEPQPGSAANKSAYEQMMQSSNPHITNPDVESSNAEFTAPKNNAMTRYGGAFQAAGTRQAREQHQQQQQETGGATSGYGRYGQ